MKLSRTLTLSAAFLVLLVTNVRASGRLCYYAIIEKVSFEPNEQEPERVQIWGVFSHVQLNYGEPGLQSPKAWVAAARGYFYAQIPPSATDQVKRSIRAEWKDFKSVAGTQQAIAFGDWDTNIDPKAQQLRMRRSDEPKGQPDPYATGTGVVKLAASGNQPRIVEGLKAALK